MTLPNGHGLLGIISMSVLSSSGQKTRKKRHAHNPQQPMSTALNFICSCRRLSLISARLPHMTIVDVPFVDCYFLYQGLQRNLFYIAETFPTTCMYQYHIIRTAKFQKLVRTFLKRRQ